MPHLTSPASQQGSVQILVESRFVVGSREEWDRLEAPLKALDPYFADFARGHSCGTRTNYHSWPMREFTWETGDGLKRSIDVHLDDKENLLFAIEGQASEGSDQAHLRGYFHVRSILFGNLLSAPLDPQRVLQILEKAYGELNRLTALDLERVEVKDQPAPNVMTLLMLAVRGYWDALGHNWWRK